MAAVRPIQRELYVADGDAMFAHAVHAGVGITEAPNVHPGMLITNPETAGVQVRGGLGGGYFNPMNNRKFR